MLKNYLNTAWRNITKQRLTSFINIGSLSIATAAVVIIVLWVQNELSFDNYHRDKNSIFLLKNTWQFDKNEQWVVENSFYPLANAIQQSVPEVGLVTRMDRIPANELTLTIQGRRFREKAGMYVDSNWFKVFDYTFTRGSANAFNANANGIVLTEWKARQLFGTTDIIGKQVGIGSTQFVVEAVIKDNPVNSSFQYDVILPFYTQDYDLTDWLYLRCRTFVKVKPATDNARVEGKINALIKANSKADGQITTRLLGLGKMHFYNDVESSAFIRGNSKTVSIFSLLAVLLLLAAATNYVNLSVARASERLKEISVRKITGATRLQLFAQLMAESVVTSLLALAITVMLVTVCLPVLKIFTGTNFTFNPFTLQIGIILTGTFISITLLTGVYPALLLSSFKPVSLFKGENILGLKNVGLKKMLITAQFALAIFMITAVVTVYRQLKFIQKQAATFNKAQVFTAQVPPFVFNMGIANAEAKRETTLKAIKLELTAKSQIKTVSRTAISLVNENFTISNGIDWEGKPQDFQPAYTAYYADADITKIVHLEMAEGRWFDDKNENDKTNYVLNETAVKKFGLKEPVIGKRFNKGIVIGVVKDFIYQSMHQQIGAVVLSIGHANVSNFAIQAQPGQAKQALLETEAVWKKYFPGEFFDYTFADEEFDALYKNDEKALSFTLIFSGLSILICCMGLLGVAAVAAKHRRKEIGIRKVFGATVAGIVTLISKDFLQLVLKAAIIATPISWWAMDKWLQEYAYRVNIGVWVFCIAGILAMLIAMATIISLAIKAAIANPARSLRIE